MEHSISKIEKRKENTGYLFERMSTRGVLYCPPKASVMLEIWGENTQRSVEDTGKQWGAKSKGRNWMRGSKTFSFEQWWGAGASVVLAAAATQAEDELPERQNGKVKRLVSHMSRKVF